MRGRSINRWVIGGLVLVLLAGLGYALFPFIVDEDRYREPLEAGASFVLGQTVTIDGPISLNLSFNPTLVLEDVHIANPAWASRPDLIHAARLEAQLSLLALVRRKLVVNNILIDGIDLLLEEGPGESNNWTFGAPSDRAGSSKPESPISATISQAGFLAIQRVTIAYQQHMASGPPSPLTIVEGSVIPVDDWTRKFSLRGEFRDIPFALEFTGGKIVDLIDLTEPWPIDGVVTAVSTSLTVNGHLIGPPTAMSIVLKSAVRGERLSDLNPLLDMDLPPLGPYDVTTSLSLAENTIGLSDVLAKIGDSEVAGDVKVLNQGESTHISGTLTANTLQVNDFQFPDSSPPPDRTPEISHAGETFISQTGMGALGIDLEFKVNRLLYDRIDLGTLALSAKLENGLLSVTPLQAKSFGGIISASLEIDGNHPAPDAIFHANAQDVHYGQALQAFEVTDKIAGSTNLQIDISGQGATLAEVLDQTTLSLSAGPSSLIVGDEANGDKVVMNIRQASVKAAPGEALKASIRGTLKEKALDIALLTGGLAHIGKPDKPWPISLFVRSDDASFTTKGGIGVGTEGVQVALAFALKGQQLNHLDTSLPSLGPYLVKAQFRKNGNQYSLTDLNGRLGESDVKGSLRIDMGKNIPHFSAALSSGYLNMSDFFPSSAPRDNTPANDMTIPVELLQSVDADIAWKVKRFEGETVQLGDLGLGGNLKLGRLDITTLQGKLIDRQKTYAEFQGDFALETARAIPILSGKASVQNLDYGHWLQRVGRTDQPVGVARVDAHFSSRGNRLMAMLAQLTLKMEAQGVGITLQNQDDGPETVLNVTKAILSSEGGGPILLSVKGSFKDRPFTIASSSADLSRLLQETLQWPVALAVQFPQLLIDLNGHLLFPGDNEKFKFQVSVKGESLQDLSFLSETALPDLGPFTLSGLLAQFTEGYRLTELHGQMGPNDLSGHLTFLTTDPRPKLMATLRSESNEFGFLTKTRTPSLKPEEGTSLKGIADSIGRIGTEIGESVAAMGSKTVTDITQSLGFEEKEEENPTRIAHIFPDFTFPVDTLRAVDLALDWEIHQVQSKGVPLGHISTKVTLQDGLLTIGPLHGTLWHGALDGKIEFDASQYVQTLAVQLRIQGLDVGFLDETVGVKDLVKGNVDLMQLDLKSRGTTLREILSRANGKAELVQGPFEITNDYIDFWAADVFTLTLTKAWEKEHVTKLNCLVGYFDIVDGEIQSQAILLDTKKITVGGFGTLNLGSETMDLILTPRPKHFTLATLANPVRIHGHLSDPEVTSDKLRIAQGGGWYLLGLVSPIGLTIVIPKIAGTTLGTGNENPCVAAMSEKQFTVQEVSELQEGFLDWMVRKMKGVFASDDASNEATKNNEKRVQ